MGGGGGEGLESVINLAIQKLRLKFNPTWIFFSLFLVYVVYF